jgi:signal transduction histidine kinase
MARGLSVAAADLNDADLNELEALRPLCHSDAAFEQLKQRLRQREANRTQPLPPEALPSRPELESQHQTISQTKSRFLAMVSHELRTPLNAILGLSALLLRQAVGPLNPKQTEYLGYIHDSGEHLLAIISDILDLSKVEAGQERLRLAAVALPELCQSCLAMVQPRAAEKHIVLGYRVAEDAMTGLADERRLRQMLLNLLSNAVKFTAQGQVQLTVQRRGESLEFCVEDTGIGIAPEHLEQIFQPFTQLDHQLNRQYEGAGLGLSLTRQLAQLHGGTLRVESTVGQGSRFLLSLPQRVEGAGGVDRDGSAAPDPAAAAQRLVIIDRQPEHHRALETYIRTCGWRVSVWGSWAAAQADLAQADLVMVGDGELQAADLAHRLRQLKALPQPPRVALLSPAGGDRPQLGPVVDMWVTLPLTIPKLERLLSLCPTSGWEGPRNSIH